MLISLARHSALARYLIINLGIEDWLVCDPRSPMIFGSPRTRSRAMPAIPTSTDHKRVKDSLDALDAFFRDVPERVGLPPDRVLFTLGQFRYPSGA